MRMRKAGHVPAPRGLSGACIAEGGFQNICCWDCRWACWWRHRSHSSCRSRTVVVAVITNYRVMQLMLTPHGIDHESTSLRESGDTILIPDLVGAQPREEVYSRSVALQTPPWITWTAGFSTYILLCKLCGGTPGLKYASEPDCTRGKRGPPAGPE